MGSAERRGVGGGKRGGGGMGGGEKEGRGGGEWEVGKEKGIKRRDKEDRGKDGEVMDYGTRIRKELERWEGRGTGRE